MVENTLPSGPETMKNMVDQMQDFIRRQLNTDNSHLKQLGERTFKTEKEAEIALQKLIKDIWNSATNDKELLGLSMSFDDLLSVDRLTINEFIRAFSLGLFQILEPALESNGADLNFNFSNENLKKITDRASREFNNVALGKALPAGEPNDSIDLAIARLKGYCKLAKSRLKTTIKQGDYPVTPKELVKGRDSIWTAFETAVLSLTFGMMMYGQRGITDAKIQEKAMNDINTGNIDSAYVYINQNPILHEMTTWGPGFLGALIVSGGTVWSMREFRKNRIDRSNRERLEGVKDKTKFRKVKDFGQDIGYKLPFFAALSVGLLYVDGAGLVASNAKGYYTSMNAHNIAKRVNHTLDINDPNSEAHKALAKLKLNEAQIAQIAESLVQTEEGRGNARGQGPAYVAKRYLIDGSKVLKDPRLDSSPKLKAIVQQADDALRRIGSSEYNENYPTLIDKAGRMSELTEKRISQLYTGGEGTITDKNGVSREGHIPGLADIKRIENERRHAEPVDLKLVLKGYQDATKNFIDDMTKANQTFKQRLEIYQKFIDEITKESDAKYNSKTSFKFNTDFAPPDMSELQEALNTPLPEFNAISPFAYYSKLKELVGVEGGITQANLYLILAWVAFRLFACEVASFGCMFGEIIKVNNTYSKPRNSLSAKKDELEKIYESFVIAVHDTFSGANWHALFPGHPGITMENAEYMVREYLIGVNPELEKFKPLSVLSGQTKKTIKGSLRSMGRGLKNVFTGDSRTDEERYVRELNLAFLKLSKQAQSGSDTMIPTKDLTKIIEKILPPEKMFDKIRGEKTDHFDTMINQIAIRYNNLQNLTIETIDKENNIRSEEIKARLENLRNWALSDEVRNAYERLEASIGIEQDVVVCSTLCQNIDELRQLLKGDDFTIDSISNLERQQRSIIEFYNGIGMAEAA